MQRFRMSLLLATALCLGATATAAQVTNGSFEDGGGSFTGWTVTDYTTPFFPVAVVPGGISPGFGFFSSAPTDGFFTAATGFDGGGPDTCTVAQDVTLGPCDTSLLFDWRGAYDMTFGAAADRMFHVDIEPSGGGAAMQSDLIFTGVAGMTVTDTGPMSASVDISAFAGTSVRISFEWDIPEAFTGPAFVTLDNVAIVGTSAVGSETPRMATPPNPGILAPGVSGPPTIGALWEPTVVLPAPGVLDVIFVSAQPGINVFLPSLNLTLLCVFPPPPSQIFFNSPGGTTFAIPVPPLCSLIGVPLCSQGAALAPGNIFATNALDLVVGG